MSNDVYYTYTFLHTSLIVVRKRQVLSRACSIGEYVHALPITTCINKLVPANVHKCTYTQMCNYKYTETSAMTLR